MPVDTIPLHAMPILEALSRCHGSISFAELKEETALAQATLNRILNTLCSYGYAMKIGHGKYLAGPKLVSMGMAISKNQIVPGFKPQLCALRQETQLNAELYVISAGGPVFLTHFPAPGEASVSFSYGHVVLNRTAHPAALFYLAKYKSQKVAGYKENFIADRGGQWPELFRAASMIRKSNYCLALSGMLTNVEPNHHDELRRALHAACRDVELPCASTQTIN
jgi:DNA-binding IclR family transcriptional regulator